jgi:pimeloyl-ACP methyl ester carboxylesterase
LACAARLPGCIAALCVSGVAPYDGEGLDFLAGQGDDSMSNLHFTPNHFNPFSDVQDFSAAIKGEEELQKFCTAMRQELLQADIPGLIEALSSVLPEVDKKAMADNPEGAKFMVDTLNESLCLGSDGWVDDDLSFVKPWGFDLSEIKVPVILYQGSEDKMVPFAHGEWLAEHLPKDKLEKHLVPGEGHISIFVGLGEKMIDELLGFAKL